MFSEGIVGNPSPMVSTTSVADYARSVLERLRSLPKEGARSVSAKLPGLSINIHSFDDAMAEAARRNLIRFSGAVSFPTLEMTVSIIHEGVPGSPAAARWSASEPYMPHRVARTLDAAGLRAEYYFELGHWHVCDPSLGIAAQVMRRPGLYPPWETGAPLRPFLHWHYARRGMRLTHAGTLGLDGKGVLLAGAGGSGKSGTVIAGLLNGLQSVGDDYVLLNADQGISAYPLYATLKQDPAGYERLGLGRLLPPGGGLNWQGKHQFLIDQIAPQGLPPSLEIGAMLVPRVADARRTTIAAMPRAEAMMALAKSSIYQMPGERESGFRYLGMVTRRLPCFRLDLGREPVEITDTIGNFIGRLRQ
jgi:hypothetical protein